MIDTQRRRRRSRRTHRHRVVIRQLPQPERPGMLRCLLAPLIHWLPDFGKIIQGALDAQRSQDLFEGYDQQEG